MAHPDDSDVAPLRFDAAVLAWVWPGAGHLLMGERRRGLLIMIAMLGMVFGGLFVGGIDVVDRRNDKLWFLAQSGCGPTVFVLDAIRTRTSPAQTYDFRPNATGRVALAQDDGTMQRELRRSSLAHLNEIGTLYIALAGLMNIVVILDCVNPHRVRSRQARRGGEA